MKNWTLRQRILASFAVIIAIMLLMVVVSYSRLLKIEDSEVAVRDDAVPGVYLSSMIRSAWVDSYLQTLELLGLREDKKLSDADKAEFKSFEARIQQQMSNYAQTIAGSEDRSEFDRFEGLHQAYNKSLSTVLDSLQRGDLVAARKEFDSQLTPTWTAGRMKLNDIITENKNVADRATNAIDDAVSAAKLSMFLSLAVAILAAGLCGLLLMRAIMAPMQRIVEILGTMRDGDLSKRLNLERKDEFNAVETGFNDMMTELTALVSQAQRSSVQVTTSVTEIAATSKQQQATATETAATTTEIGATSREIAATSKDLVRTMTEVSTAADQASVAAGSGQQGLARMEETMHSVMGAADLVNAKLAILNEKAGNINQVVVTIVKVADQTNLLSLNAAIEAEKAGEYGRGFAVVATEVRNLAQRSAAAAKEIKLLIDDSVGKVAAGSKLVDEAGATMEQVVDSVRKVTAIMADISVATTEQSDGIAQVNQALAQMDGVTQQNAALVEEAAAAAESLQDQASHLADVVSVFKLGEQARQVAPPAVAPVAHAAPPRMQPVKTPAAGKRLAAAKPAPAERAPAKAPAGDDWEEF